MTDPVQQFGRTIRATPRAVAKILQMQGADKLVVRLGVYPHRPMSQKYELEFVSGDEQNANELKLDVDGISILLERGAMHCVVGMLVDYRVEMWRSGFHFENPNRFLMMGSSRLAELVDSAIVRYVNPVIRKHDGRVVLVDVLEATAYLEFSGGCRGCSFAPLTLQGLISQIVKSHVPGIANVVDVTHHVVGRETFRGRSMTVKGTE